MRSFATKSKNIIKKSFLLADYLFWLLFDFSKFKKIRNERIKSVIIISKGAIGDMALATTILPIIKNQLKCKITMMARKGGKEVLINDPNVDEIVDLSDGFQKNFELLKNGNFDLAIILSPASLRISYACLLAGIKYRIGCFKGIRDGPAFFYTRRSFPLKNIHGVEKHVEIIKPLKLKIDDLKINLHYSKKDMKSVRKWLKSKKIKDYIIIHPGFSSILKNPYPSRLWPLENYAKVIDYLTRKYKIKVILTGSDDEKIISEQILNKSKNKKDILLSTGTFKLGELFSLISKAKLVISGSMAIHLATAFNTPVVALEGKSNPREWHPWNPKGNYIMLYHPEVCTSCENEYCRKKNQECMKAITAEEVMAASDKLLDNNYI